MNVSIVAGKRKPSEEGLCYDCGFSTGFPRPHRARRTWSKPWCCQSGCLTISHNRLCSMGVIAIPLVCRLSDLSASRAHAVVCSFYRQKPRRQHLCIVERLLDCCCGAHSQQFKLYTITPKHQREVFIVTTSMTPLAYLPQPFPSMSAACLNRPR